MCKSFRLKNTLLLVLSLLLSISILLACSQKEAGGDLSKENHTSTRPLTDQLEEILDQDITMSEDELVDYQEKIMKLLKEDDMDLLRKEASFIGEKLEEGSLEQPIYQNLYYRAFYEVRVGSEDQKEHDKLFLNREDIQDQEIKKALADIGTVTTVSEEFLQELRAEVVRLVRGGAETEDEFFSYREDFDELMKTMNNIDTSACNQLFSVAQEEAFHGSKTFPLDD